jgi:hypothetical protein
LAVGTHAALALATGLLKAVEITVNNYLLIESHSNQPDANATRTEVRKQLTADTSASLFRQSGPPQADQKSIFE